MHFLAGVGIGSGYNVWDRSQRPSVSAHQAPAAFADERRPATLGMEVGLLVLVPAFNLSNGPRAAISRLGGRGSLHSPFYGDTRYICGSLRKPGQVGALDHREHTAKLPASGTSSAR